MRAFSFEPADRIAPAQLQQAFEAAFADYLLGPFTMTRAQWPVFLGRQGVELGASRVAMQGDEVLAFALVAPRPAIGRWRLATMGALPPARGSGAAPALLDDFIARATAAGLPGVELECFAQNERALRLYRGRGFEPVHPLLGYTRPAGPLPAEASHPAGSTRRVDLGDAFEWLAEVDLRRGDLPLQVTPTALKALPVVLQAWRQGTAQLVFAAAGDDALTIHSLVDTDAAQRGAQALVAELVREHPRHRIAAPQLQRPDLGGDALERVGFERLPLYQWLMRRAA